MPEILCPLNFQYDFYNNLERIAVPQKFDPENELLVFQENIYNSQNIAYTSDSTLFIQNDLFGSFSYDFSSSLITPISILKNENTNYILGTIFPDSLFVLKFNIKNDPILEAQIIKTGDPPIDTPISLNNNTICYTAEHSIILYKLNQMTLEQTYKLEKETQKISFNPETNRIIALHPPDTLSLYDLKLQRQAQYTFEQKIGNYYPLSTIIDDKLVIFIQENCGNIYRYSYNQVEQIFDITGYPFENISNISLGDVNHDASHDIVFTADNEVFAISNSGSLLSEFPKSLSNSSYANSSPLIGHNLFTEDLSLLLPTDNDYSQTITENCNISEYYSFSFGRADASPFFHQTESYRTLIYPESDSIITLINFDMNTNFQSKIYWNGFQNGANRWSYVEPPISGQTHTVTALSIKAFPNPVSYGPVTIRIKSPEEKKAQVKIYNLAAELLFSDNKLLKPDLNNDFRWNISDVSSGVYFAKLKIGAKDKLIKIGVIK